MKIPEDIKIIAKSLLYATLITLAFALLINGLRKQTPPTAPIIIWNPDTTYRNIYKLERDVEWLKAQRKEVQKVEVTYKTNLENEIQNINSNPTDSFQYKTLLRLLTEHRQLFNSAN